MSKKSATYLKHWVRLFLANVLVLFLLLAAVEALLGDWHKPKPPVSNLPDANWNKKMVIDATRQTGVSEVLYTVDDKGYRGLNDLNNDNIVLTIGGSTTEQILVGDGKTWQDQLASMYDKKYQFLNGGVGGQTTFGHIYAIEKWHTKELRPTQVRAVIFYIGINDIALLNGKHNENETPKKNYYQFQIFLSRNSFFYQRLKIVKDNLRVRMNGATKNTKSNHVIWWGHSRRSESFVDDRQSQEIKLPGENDYRDYKSLISNLVIKTRSGFPSASIIFVQQQIPGCRFPSPFQVVDRHPVSTDETLRWCKSLGELYLSQDQAFMSLPKSEQPIILKMYLAPHISDEGVYDYTHTNEFGSFEIARYLRDNLPF